MKTQLQVQVDTTMSKRLIVCGLFLLAGAIILSGALFCTYSYINNITMRVLNVNVPGMIFGLMIIYFGIRSAFSVSKLRLQLYKDDARFSWSNFKRQKNKK